jgi:hypothetical protein
MSIAVDNRHVVLLKSLKTNNRFYTLVPMDSGYKNADAIEEFPPHLHLGIAYPCLEDGLNDFAVIRTTFETIEVFPEDDELRTELMTIIDDARGNLVRRLKELRDRIVEGRAHFLGTKLQEFKDHILHMAHRGAPRRTLDNMMKLDVFESVCRADAAASGQPVEPMYRYEFLPQHHLSTMDNLPPRVFIGRLFDDVLDEVTNDLNYRGKNTFDKSVFQKFIAVMFTNYATTDPVFYGTSREDYGVSSDKSMDDTPLYQAVKSALRELERAAALEREMPSIFGEEVPGDLSDLFKDDQLFQPLQEAGHTVEIPFGAGERMLLQPLAILADAMRLLQNVDHPRATEVRTMVCSAGQQIFRGLQELKIVSGLANDPLEDASRE